MSADAVDDVCAKRHRGAPTSEEAHESIRESKERILDCLAVRGPFGGTCEEIARHLGMRYTTASGRLAELKHAKKKNGQPRAVESGQRRPTSKWPRGRRDRAPEVQAMRSPTGRAAAASFASSERTGALRNLPPVRTSTRWLFQQTPLFRSE